MSKLNITLGAGNWRQTRQGCTDEVTSNVLQFGVGTSSGHV
jgi:hypothetical protein